jgi:hypothetical protein
LGSTLKGCDGGMLEVKVVGASISANWTAAYWDSRQTKEVSQERDLTRMLESKPMHTDFVLSRCVYAATRAKFEVCGKLLGTFGHLCRHLAV